MKEKLSLFVTNNFCLTLLASYIIKCLITGPSISDAIIVISISALFGFDKLLRSKIQPPINQAILKEIEMLKGKISTLSIDRGIKRDEQQKRYF